MDYYQELKSKVDILSVAFALKYDGEREGSCYQGNCPKHGSTGEKCFTIWPRIQGFKCYHKGCGETGDVVDLIMLFTGMSHKEARDYLADRAGMAHLEDKTLSPEEIQKKKAEVEEKRLVEEMLTEATQYFHRQLDNYPEIDKYLHEHYGFSSGIIRELQIGFAPPPEEGHRYSELAEYLSSFPNFKGNLALSGLFIFNDPAGPYWDYFNGRIIFPYWRGGRVIYLAGRATSLTPVTQYEYYHKDGNIKQDEKGNPIPVKYKKLRRHDQSHARKKHISRFIQNDIFMGEDTIRGAKEILIPEGAPDWVSAVDKGFAAISPVTTNFREDDFEKLRRLTEHAETIYIINDNEKNQAGEMGALKTAKYLAENGKNVYIVQLPRPEDRDKIDLNEFFLDHTAEDLRKIMESSKSYLEVLIDGLPNNYIKAQPTIHDEIAPILIKLDKGPREHWSEIIRKKVKTTQKAIIAEIEYVEEQERLKQSMKKEEKRIDPEVEEKAEKIAIDPLSFKHRLDLLNQLGVVGERGTLAMYYAALDSRLLPPNYATPNTLSVKNAGHPGSGKSFTLMMALEIYPESCYKLITNGSAKGIYYLKDGLKNKALIVTEGFQFQENNSGDSELVYTVRSLISEGRVRYPTVGKDENGNPITIEKVIDGPTSFVTTTIMESLEVQLEDRLFTIHPDESPEQTKRIIQKTGQVKSGNVPSLDRKIIEGWKLFHASLTPVDVIIPYAEKISNFITERDNIPIATRRAFNRATVVIQTIACFYQKQRQKDKLGRIIAEISDYAMALQIVHEAFRENLGNQSEKTEKRLKLISDKDRILPKELAHELGVSVSAISQWTKKKVEEGLLWWVDQDGTVFSNEKDLDKAKRSGKAYLRTSDSYSPVNVGGLPTPFELTGDPVWDVDGDLLLKYDLDLEMNHGDAEIPKQIEETSSKQDIEQEVKEEGNQLLRDVESHPPSTPDAVTATDSNDGDQEEDNIEKFLKLKFIKTNSGGRSKS